MTHLLPLLLDSQADLVDVDGLLAEGRKELLRVRQDLLAGLASLEVGEEGRLDDRHALGESVGHLPDKISTIGIRWE